MEASASHSAKGTGRRVRITVRGRLSERFATAFEEMALVTGRGHTDLVGEVTDQAHLYGLLARVRDLGLELEGVSLAPQVSGPRARSSTAPFATNSEVDQT